MICYHYATVLDKRFILGEEMISKDAESSYEYVLHILNGRFELGEVMIKQSEYCGDYENHFNIKL